MTTVTLTFVHTTFVHTTFVHTTFVHIRNISFVTDKIFMKLFRPNYLQAFFWIKIFFHTNLLDPKSFGANFLLGPKFCYTKIIFDPKFLAQAVGLAVGRRYCGQLSKALVATISSIFFIVVFRFVSPSPTFLKERVLQSKNLCSKRCLDCPLT